MDRRHHTHLQQIERGGGTLKWLSINQRIEMTFRCRTCARAAARDTPRLWGTHGTGFDASFLIFQLCDDRKEKTAHVSATRDDSAEDRRKKKKKKTKTRSRCYHTYRAITIGRFNAVLTVSKGCRGNRDVSFPLGCGVAILPRSGMGAHTA